MSTPFQVVYEDNHLLAIAKPAGLATQGVKAGERSLATMAKAYLKRKYRKPGNVYLGIVSRLDADTSGVVLLARTSKAAARLSQQFRERLVKKTYWAVVEGSVAPETAELTDWLVKNERLRRMEIAGAKRAGAQEARMSYRRLKAFSGETLLEIDLQTGRKHQIRVQLAARGHPVVGDRKYGSQRAFARGIALHCRRLRFAHPVGHAPIELTAPVPEAWHAYRV